jgi:hypothetical protein
VVTIPRTTPRPGTGTDYGIHDGRATAPGALSLLPQIEYFNPHGLHLD